MTSEIRALASGHISGRTVPNPTPLTKPGSCGVSVGPRGESRREGVGAREFAGDDLDLRPQRAHRTGDAAGETAAAERNQNRLDVG